MTIQITNLILLVLCFFALVATVLLLVSKKGATVNLDTQKLQDQIEQNAKMQKELSNTLNGYLLQSVKDSNQNLLNAINGTNTVQMQHLTEVIARLNSASELQTKNMHSAITVVEQGLLRLQQDNSKKLEEMRVTVDEKLNSSLENRLTQSFNIINERLQSVYEGIGVMKQLATGVGDLKKVLTNVKTRGVWGEVQLKNLLSQILTPDQFKEQVQIDKSSLDRVDFVVNMPGKDSTILLPIDAKFPLEDYERLMSATEVGDKALVDASVKNLEKRVKEECKKIANKYIIIPQTTDFAVLYVPIEGLYAEILRIDGLCDYVQQNNKVVICGPTTLSALLNSLQLGFKSLEVEKRSSEVFALLSVFKAEFAKFVVLLSKTQKKLTEASNTIDFATKKSKTIESKLKKVQALTKNKEVDEAQIVLENEYRQEFEEIEMQQAEIETQED